MLCKRCDNLTACATCPPIESDRLALCVSGSRGLSFMTRRVRPLPSRVARHLRRLSSSSSFSNSDILLLSSDIFLTSRATCFQLFWRASCAEMRLITLLPARPAGWLRCSLSSAMPVCSPIVYRCTVLYNCIGQLRYCIEVIERHHHFLRHRSFRAHSSCAALSPRKSSCSCFMCVSSHEAFEVRSRPCTKESRDRKDRFEDGRFGPCLTMSTVVP